MKALPMFEEVRIVKSTILPKSSVPSKVQMGLPIMESLKSILICKVLVGNKNVDKISTVQYHGVQVYQVYSTLFLTTLVWFLNNFHFFPHAPGAMFQILLIILILKSGVCL